MNTLTRTLASLDPEAGASTEITAHDEDLLRAIMEQPLPAPMRKQRTHVRRTFVVGGLVAATVALGLIKIDIGGHEVGASPVAAAVLERAADAALAEPNPVVGPGQYLRITLVEESWGAYYDKNSDEANSVTIGSDGKPVVFKERRTRQMWVPHELNDPWTIRDGTKPLRQLSKDVIPNTDEPTRTWINPSWADKANRKSYIKTYDPAWYATLPRDPEKLLARLASEDKGDGSSANFLFQEVFSEVLRSGIAPADIRATLFEALAERPEMTVVDGATNLDGRRGVALQFRGSTWQMLFDRDTGAYIGERATDPDFPDVPGLDADKTTWLSTVQTEVVDSAPKPD